MSLHASHANVCRARGTDPGVLVVERGDEVGEGLLVGEVIENAGARAPDDGLRMLESAAYRR